MMDLTSLTMLGEKMRGERGMSLIIHRVTSMKMRKVVGSVAPAGPPIKGTLTVEIGGYKVYCDIEGLDFDLLTPDGTVIG